jgi:hypothetical protein
MSRAGVEVALTGHSIRKEKPMLMDDRQEVSEVVR